MGAEFGGGVIAYFYTGGVLDFVSRIEQEREKRRTPLVAWDSLRGTREWISPCALVMESALRDADIVTIIFGRW